VQFVILLFHAAIQIVLGQVSAFAIVVLVVFEAGQILLHELAALAYKKLSSFSEGKEVLLISNRELYGCVIA